MFSRFFDFKLNSLLNMQSTLAIIMDFRTLMWHHFNEKFLIVYIIPKCRKILIVHDISL